VERDRKRRRRRGGERLIGLFAVGCVLFSPPLVVLAGGGDLLGLPSGYAYLFLAWAFIIAALALVVEEPRRRGIGKRQR
jgi:hypothetical protein